MKLKKMINGQEVTINLTKEEVERIVKCHNFYFCTDDAALALIQMANLYDPNEQPGEYIAECLSDYGDIVEDIRMYVSNKMKQSGDCMEEDWTIDDEPIHSLLVEAVQKYWREDLRVPVTRTYKVRVKEVNYYHFDVEAKSYEDARYLAEDEYYQHDTSDCDVQFEIDEVEYVKF